MVSIRSASLSLLLSVAALSAAHAVGQESADQARGWLERSAQALHGLNYRGTFVYLHDNQLHAQSIVHQVDAGGEFERLLSLTGSAREVLRDDKLVTCILPESRSVVIERSQARRSFPLVMPEHIDHLEKYYAFHLGSADRVAGRPVQRVGIRPLDDLRYGHEFWIDVESGMLLKADLIDESGHAVEQFMFTHIEFFSEMPGHLLEPEISSDGFTLHRHREIDTHAPGGGGVWEVAALPDGFTLELQQRKHISASPNAVDHLVYSDGLSTLSVFIEPVDGEQPPLRGDSRMGAVNAYSTLFGDHQITVVGALPERTVRLVGDGIRPVLSQ